MRRCTIRSCTKISTTGGRTTHWKASFTSRTMQDVPPRTQHERSGDLTVCGPTTTIKQASWRFVCQKWFQEHRSIQPQPHLVCLNARTAQVVSFKGSRLAKLFRKNYVRKWERSFAHHVVSQLYLLRANWMVAYHKLDVRSWHQGTNLYWWYTQRMLITEGSLEAKLATRWTDGKHSQEETRTLRNSEGRR